MTACFIDSGLEHGNFFLNSDISQGSVVTQLRCGGIITKGFVVNLLVNLSVKEFRKSVNIWRSYGQYYSGLFFIDSQCRCRAVTLPRRETRSNMQACPKLVNRSQPLVGPSSRYVEDTLLRNKFFSRLLIHALVAKI